MRSIVSGLLLGTAAASSPVLNFEHAGSGTPITLAGVDAQTLSLTCDGSTENLCDMESRMESRMQTYVDSKFSVLNTTLTGFASQLSALSASVTGTSALSKIVNLAQCNVDPSATSTYQVCLDSDVLTKSGVLHSYQLNTNFEATCGVGVDHTNCLGIHPHSSGAATGVPGIGKLEWDIESICPMATYPSRTVAFNAGSQEHGYVTFTYSVDGVDVGTDEVSNYETPRRQYEIPETSNAKFAISVQLNGKGYNSNHGFIGSPEVVCRHVDEVTASSVEAALAEPSKTINMAQCTVFSHQLNNANFQECNSYYDNVIQASGNLHSYQLNTNFGTGCGGHAKCLGIHPHSTTPGSITWNIEALCPVALYPIRKIAITPGSSANGGCDFHYQVNGAARGTDDIGGNSQKERREWSIAAVGGADFAVTVSTGSYGYNSNHCFLGTPQLYCEKANPVVAASFVSGTDIM